MGTYPFQMSSFMPKTVRRYAAAVTEGTGESPSVEETSPGHWQLRLANNRVELTIDFDRDRAGKTSWVGSTLSVDGQPRKLIADPQELGELFRNPDGHRTLDPLPANADLDEAPVALRAGLREQYETIAGLLVGETVHVGRDSGGTWIVGVDTTRLQLRARYVSDKPGIYHPVMELVVDGVDRSRAANKDLAGAIAEAGLLHRPASEGQSQPAGHTASAARSNAVETRRSTVIRV